MKWTNITDQDLPDFAPLQKYSTLLRRLLIQREIRTGKAAEQFLNPSLDDLPAPIALHDTDKAAEIILKAIAEKQKIFIYGDYDVDGVTSTAIVFDFLYRELKAQVLPYIPDRFDEGYGLNDIGLQEILKQKGNLVITVDCGIRDYQLVKKYQELGLQFIITDHHTLPEAELPDALALVHPGLSPDLKFTQICGANVAWKLVQVIAELAWQRGLIQNPLAVEHYLDLVALATTCDVMPLIEENRVILTFGLKQFKFTKNLGLQALMRYLNLDPGQIEAYHLGFLIGPRLNAGGRIEHAIEGVRLLTTNQSEQADKIVKRLDELNTYRQKITTDLVIQAEEQITGQPEMKKLLFLYGADWPEGIVGLAAGKLSEKYHRPVLIGSLSNGKVKGSARSIKNFHITEAIAQFAGNLEKFGGHKLAAGFLVSVEQLDQFQLGLEQLADKMLTHEDLIPELEIEYHLPASEWSLDTLAELKKFEPFGFGNKKPLLQIDAVQIRSLKFIGKEHNHVKFEIFDGSDTLECIAFNQALRFSDLDLNQKFDFVGTLEGNFWNGETRLQFNFKDFRVYEKSR
ncbi:MAG: single-stranded-DNA-specific exonuclease RecJ [bacterium]